MADFGDFLETTEPSSTGFESAPAHGFAPSYEETPNASFVDATPSYPTDSYGSSEPASHQQDSAFNGGADTYNNSDGYSAPQSHASNYDIDVPASSSSFTPSYDNFQDTPLTIYRREHADFIEKKDAAAENARLDLLAKARTIQQEINSGNADKNAKRAAKNREDEQKYIADRDAILEGSNYTNDWERVGALIDVKAPTIGRDTNRLRKLLIELKH